LVGGIVSSSRGSGPLRALEPCRPGAVWFLRRGPAIGGRGRSEETPPDEK